jgi:mono/diheme cytochrome c family protein
MRHLLANIITYTIAALLFIGAAAFAWMRSSQLTLSNEHTLLAQYRPAADAFAWETPGAAGYDRNCRNCHGARGEGWDQYPPLSEAAAAAATSRGREHLIDVVLYGLTSRRWGAPMPPMAHMQDVEVAAVLNYIAATFLDQPLQPALMPADVAARRGQRLRPVEVNARRPQ